MAYIKQGKSNINLDKPCPNNPRSGIHKWGFRPNEMYCGNCNWIIPVARLVCEHCGKVNRFFRADLIPNSIGLVDVFECEYCNEFSPIQDKEIQ